MPIFNVDGVAFIEKNWLETGKFMDDRKNMNEVYGACDKSGGGGLDIGVDLNRNFAVDFGQVDDILKYQLSESLEKKADKNRSTDPCSTFFPGPKPFSEPETQAYKKFLEDHQDEIRFILNVHSNGNAFIWPFNGRREQDMETRRPGFL